MLMTAGKFNDLRHLCFCNLVGEHPTNSHTVAVDMQHDLDGGFAAFAEERLEDVNDELHRRVVVVQQKNLVEAGLLGFRTRARDDAGSRTRAVASALSVLVVSHVRDSTP